MSKHTDTYGEVNVCPQCDARMPLLGLHSCNPTYKQLKTSHDALLAACKFAKSQIKKGAQKKALPILRAAIAAAEGKV